MNIQENVVDLKQRLQRKIRMRAMTPKLTRTREFARMRLADDKKLRKRSRRIAKSMMRKRVAGSRGANYSELGVSDKIIVDKMVDPRQKMIVRLATRLLPKVRSAEVTRYTKRNLQQSWTKDDLPLMLEELGEEALPAVKKLTRLIIENTKPTKNIYTVATLAAAASLLTLKCIQDPAFADRANLRTVFNSVISRALQMVVADPSIMLRARRAVSEETIEETGGAGFQGTPELVYKYIKDTPGQKVYNLLKDIRNKK